jgi:hypothetical protein
MAPGYTEDTLGQEDFGRLPPSAPSLPRGGREASSHRLTWLTKSAEEPASFTPVRTEADLI